MPNQNGNFDLVGVNDFARFAVEGPTQSSLPPSRSRSSITMSSTPSTSNLPSLPPPTFRSVIAPRKAPSFSLKVVKAKLTRTGKKAVIQPISQTYIELVDSTANLDHIMTVIHQRWSSQVVLVTNDGAELDESPAMHGVLCVLTNLFVYIYYTYLGLNFWKSPRRKLYAVSRKDLADFSSCTNSSIILSDSDEDDFQPHKKKPKKEDSILSGVNNIQSSIADMMSLTEHSTIPLGLQKIARETFICKICHVVPIKPPSPNVVKLSWVVMVVSMIGIVDRMP